MPNLLSNTKQIDTNLLDQLAYAADMLGRIRMGDVARELSESVFEDMDSEVFFNAAYTGGQ